MELATETDLELRRIVKLPAAARTLNVSRTKLDELLVETNTPIVELGPKCKGMFLQHLDALLSHYVRTARVA